MQQWGHYERSVRKFWLPPGEGGILRMNVGCVAEHHHPQGSSSESPGQAGK